MDNKGQGMGYGIVFFVIITILILISAPMILKIVRTTITPIGNAFNQTIPQASSAAYSIRDSFTNLWDWVLIAMFTFNVLLLFISAFFIDTHPAFVIVYILMLFFLFMFAPSLINVVDQVWGLSTFSTETGLYLSGTTFIKDHFSGIILIIAVLSGVVMYGKIRYFPNY